jgi:O-antigen ligase
MIMLAIVSLLLTMRRSTFLATIIIVSIICIIRVVRSKITFFGKIISAALPALILILLITIIPNTGFGNVFFERLLDLDPRAGGTGSGRFTFQYNGIKYLLTRGGIESIFGEGIGSAREVNTAYLGSSIGMHSDWLDIGLSFGYVGILLLLVYFKNIINLGYKAYKNKFYGYGDTACAIFLSAFFLSLSSGGIFESHFSTSYAILGFISGSLAMNKKLITHCNKNSGKYV